MLAKLASLIKEFMSWTLGLSSEPPFGGGFNKKKLRRIDCHWCENGILPGVAMAPELMEPKVSGTCIFP